MRGNKKKTRNCDVLFRKQTPLCAGLFYYIPRTSVCERRACVQSQATLTLPPLERRDFVQGIGGRAPLPLFVTNEANFLTLFVG